MGASQFVNVVLFQFSGLASFLPAQSLLRGLSGTSSPANFFFSPVHRSQIPFDAAREKKNLDRRASMRRPSGGPAEETRNAPQGRSSAL